MVILAEQNSASSSPPGVNVNPSADLSLTSPHLINGNGVATTDVTTASKASAANSQILMKRKLGQDEVSTGKNPKTELTSDEENECR